MFLTQMTSVPLLLPAVFKIASAGVVGSAVAVTAPHSLSLCSADGQLPDAVDPGGKGGPQGLPSPRQG